MNYLTVDLYHDFTCIADACPNTCCAGWAIRIDNETYEKMLSNEDKLGIPTDDWIAREDGKCIVKLNRSGQCPLLNENNLCKVVLSLGSSYLSNVCTVYPHIQLRYGNILEGYLTPSCPEVIARLMHKDKVYFDFSEHDGSASPYPYAKLYLYESAVRTSITELLYDFCDISLGTRLFIAFRIINEAISHCTKDTPDFRTIKSLIDSFYLDGIMISWDNQLKYVVSGSSRYHFLRQVISLLPDIVTSVTPHKYVNLLDQTVSYFVQTDFEQYLKDIASFKEEIKSYHNFYTNYWVYRIFFELISIPDYSKIKDNFIFACIEFCLMQIIALASYAQNQTLDRNEYIYIISAVSRMEHSSRQKLVQQLQDNNLISGAGLLLLII